MPDFARLRAKRLFLLDLDGTLLYTLADIAAAVNGALREMHRPERTVTEIRSMVGNGAKMLITRALGPGQEALVDDTLAVYARLYAAHAQEHVTPYAGIPELLDALHERGIRTACVTNKDHTDAAPMLQKFFGIILLAISVKIFITNITVLIEQIAKSAA